MGKPKTKAEMIAYMKTPRAKWYGSAEHFNTEKSYEEHLEDIKKRLEKKKRESMPSVKQMMQGY